MENEDLEDDISPLAFTDEEVFLKLLNKFEILFPDSATRTMGVTFKWVTCFFDDFDFALIGVKNGRTIFVDELKFKDILIMELEEKIGKENINEVIRSYSK